MIEQDVIKHLQQHPFVPHPALRNAHAQTLAGYFIRRRFKVINRRTESRYFDTAPGVRVLTHCSWQEDPALKPALVLVHGMEGSTDSRYMLGTAEKALAAGLNVVRVNYRNCGGTEHLTPTLLKHRTSNPRVSPVPLFTPFPLVSSVKRQHRAGRFV